MTKPNSKAAKAQRAKEVIQKNRDKHLNQQNTEQEPQTQTENNIQRNLGGRPPVYPEELKHQILDRLAAGESLKAICAAPDMPDRTTVWRWMIADKDLSEKYELCKQSRARALFEQALGEVESIHDRDSAYIAHVKSNLLLKAAALCDPAKFSDKTHANIHKRGDGTTLNININIGGDEKTSIDITPNQTDQEPEQQKQLESPENPYDDEECYI